MNDRFPLWAARLYNQPLAIDRFKNEVLCEFAQSRILGVAPKKITSAALEVPLIAARAEEAGFQTENGRKPFRSKGDIAVVECRGELVQKGGWMDADSGLVGYDWLLRQVRAARHDPEIKGIFMPFASPGGECAGMFAAAEELASMAKAEGGKPIYAFLDEQASSAGYVLASACDRIFGRRECMGASLAALMNWVDKSKFFESVGFEAVVIRADWADRKARGITGEPIDDELIAKMSAIVNETSDQLAEFVAAMRGLTVKAIKDLRGDFFRGPDLKSFGLLDEIATEDEAWDALVKEARSA